MENILVNKKLLKSSSLNAAIIFAILMEKSNGGAIEINITREQIKNEIPISFSKQAKAIEQLMQLGLISIERKGLPCLLYYKIYMSEYLKFL